MIPTPEFSRTLRLDQIGAGENKNVISAEADERAALAKRFGLASIDSLSADYAVSRDAIGLLARGNLQANVVQTCSVTGEPIPVSLKESFAIRFLPELDSELAEENELTEDECDTIFYLGSAIDLGEAVAETLLLSLDPFPRGPNAAAALKEAGVISDEEVQPTGALAGLKNLLNKQ